MNKEVGNTAVNIGPKIGIDGEAEYRRKIENIIQQQKTYESQISAITSALGKNATAQEKASATGDIMADMVKTQEKRISLLNDMLSKAKEKYGETDTATLRWQQAVNEATADLNKMQTELRSATQDTEDLGDSMDDAGQQSLTFSDLLKSNLLSNTIMSGFSRLADAAKQFAQNMVTTAAEIKAQNSQFSQTFGDMADQATAAIKRVADESGILSTRLQDSGTKIYAFAKASGADSQTALQLMETALQAAADSAAYYDKSLSETTETLQSFLKGNYENDAALGLSATEATRNAKAYELFGTEFNNLSEIQKQQTLLKMVTDAQALSGAAGQAAREMTGWENVTGNLSEVWRQFQARVGAPFLEALVPIVQDITTKMQELTSGIDWDAFAQQVSSIIEAIVTNSQSIIAAITAIAAGIAAFKIITLISNIGELKAAIIALNLAMTANPIGILIAAISALISAIVYLWTTNDDFRAAVTKAWETIKSTASTVFSAVANFLTDTVPNAAKNMWNAIKTAVDNIISFFQNLYNSIAQYVSNIATTIVNGFNSAVSFIKSLPSLALQWGADFIQGLIDGIKAKISGVVNGVKEVADTVKSYLHFSRPDVGPLRQYERWMPDMMQGLAKGITDNMGPIREALRTVTGSMQLELQPAMAIPAQGVTYNAGGITIQVYPAEGQDEQAIADAIAYRLQDMTARKGAVFA